MVSSVCVASSGSSVVCRCCRDIRGVSIQLLSIAMIVLSILLCLSTGITYKYLGLRIFAHPWDGGSEVKFHTLEVYLRFLCTCVSNIVNITLHRIT
jgi:FTO catalytic domain